VILSAVYLPGLAAPPACAQVTVYDPANHAQNVLQAVRALQELDNQVRQLAHEIDMLENMARDLETLPVNVATCDHP
jgi:type IV secretion system protein TrbJ